MSFEIRRRTLADTCEVTGRGYWSGDPVRVVMHPATDGGGITLCRTDLPGQPSIAATIDFQVPTPLRTILKGGTATFQMVEHLMAALSGLGVDDCRVEIDGEELPGLDGSSAAYVEAIHGVGLAMQPSVRRPLVITQSFRMAGGGGWIQADPSFAGESYFEYQLAFDDHTPVRPQAFGAAMDAQRFAQSVAPARTFVTQDQAAEIRRRGLASHVTNRELLVIGRTGPIDNEYRFDNECARHKTLDLIGDLALCGAPLIGRFISYRGGHTLNGRMAARLAILARRGGIPYLTMDGFASDPPAMIQDDGCPDKRHRGPSTSVRHAA